MALHFVGFKGEEYTRACVVFGKPDFVHRLNDERFRLGGELSPDDLVIYANGSENRHASHAYNDSARF